MPKTFIVVGAYRSGTSFLTSSLKAAGVEMGGQPIHHEDNSFVLLNKDIIQAAGGTWRKPPPAPAILEMGHRYKDRIQEVIQAKKGRLRGWKDPRQALTLESYLPYLERDVYLVAVFRKPEKVAYSLNRLGQVEYQRAICLAREYDRRILKTVAQFVGVEDSNV